ncbi:MAG TPA: HD domain-containing protein [Spirochaetia bacterium]|nr:HD domain-containing protein [Spirochaetia bacterium]
MESQEDVIEKTKRYIRERLEGESSGHDWWHVCRVYNTAVTIAQRENVNMLIVGLAAILHDIADWKFTDGDETVGPLLAKEWLEENNLDETVIDHVCQIIMDISFKGAKVKSPMKTLEGKVVQDADRLDAIGAVGIARAFAYGGHKNRPIYDPNIKPQLHESPEQYMKNLSPTVNHFYEKLLLLKDLMNTETSKAMARERHDFMEEFLEKFFDECKGLS